MSRVTSIIREDAKHLVSRLAGQLDPLAGTTMLVTGAGGFLCSGLLDFVTALNDAGAGPPCRAIGLDNFQSGLPERVEHLEDRPDVRFVTHDLRQPFDPGEPVDWIVHGASIASPVFYRRFPLETIDVNVSGTRHMLDLARRGARSVLVLSTSEIYGDPDPAWIPTPEEYRGYVSCTGPRACYDESKRLAETLATTYFALHRTPVKIIRPFNVYGPGQRIDDGRIVPDLMQAALKRQPIVLYSDGRATRSLCYVRDAVAAMLCLLLSDHDGEAFNVGNDEEEIAMGALAERMADVAAPPRLAVEYRVSADHHYTTDSPQRRCPNLDKLRRATGWQPEVRLDDGLRRTLQSYRELEAAVGR